MSGGHRYGWRGIGRFFPGPGNFEIDIRRSFGYVITSYSIHYTKLYDHHISLAVLHETKEFHLELFDRLDRDIVDIPSYNFV